MASYRMGFVGVLFLLLGRLLEGQSSGAYPKLVHANIPLYPPLAAAAHVSGKVEVLYTVKGGEITSAEVRSGSPILATPTLERFKTWHFSPESYGTFPITFNYRIEGPEVVVPENPKIDIEFRIVTVTTTPVRPTCDDCPSKE